VSRDARNRARGDFVSPPTFSSLWRAAEASAEPAKLAHLATLVSAAALVASAAAHGGASRHDARPILPLAGAPSYGAAAARRAALRPWAAAAAAGRAAAGAVMTASPAAPTTSVANVTATWSGVAGAASTDWVAVYCVGAPLDGWQQWAYVSTAPGWASGAASLSFTLFRSGCDNEFRYYRDPAPYTFVVASNAVTWPGGPGGPYHLRAAFGDDPATSLTLSWTTPPGAPDAPAVLQVGTAPGVYDLPNVTAQRSGSYAADDLCTAPANTAGPDAWQPTGAFHHATATGLAPSTTYYLRPTAGGVAGAETAVRTGAPPGAATRTRLVVYADMSVSGAPGAVETSSRVAERLKAGETLDFLLHVGDLSYAEGNVATWNLWMSYIEPYAAALPYHVSVGNQCVPAQDAGRRAARRGAPAARGAPRRRPRSPAAPAAPAAASTTTRARRRATRLARGACGRRPSGTAAATRRASAAWARTGASACPRRPAATASFGTPSPRATCTSR